MHGTISPRTEAKHVVVASSLTSSLVNFRLELLRSLVAQGHRVTAMGPDRDADAEKKLAEIGVAFRPFPLARTGMNPVQDLASLRALVAAFRSLKPDVVIPYTMKPVIYAGLAARIAGVAERHALMTGMGVIYSPTATSTKHRAVRGVSDRLYRAALRGAGTVFTYNAADERDIRSRNMVGGTTRLVRVPGSGVDVARFAPTPLPERPTFTMIARLLREKGVGEFVAAARAVRAVWPEATFRLVGPLDPNPSGISRSDLEAWVATGAVEYGGAVSDVRPVLADTGVFVLPSYYREGVPRTILEAMATGRAVVTCDLDGCRDAVEDGQTGYLVRPRDADDLAAAILRFRDQPTLIGEMGERARAAAVARFDVHHVNRMILEGTGLMRTHVAPSASA